PLSDLASTWERLALAQKRRFQQYVLPVGFTAREIGTAELGLLFRVFRQFEPPNSNVVPLTVESWNQLLQEIKGLAALFDHSEEEQLVQLEPASHEWELLCTLFGDVALATEPLCCLSYPFVPE